MFIEFRVFQSLKAKRRLGCQVQPRGSMARTAPHMLRKPTTVCSGCPRRRRCGTAHTGLRSMRDAMCCFIRLLRRTLHNSGQRGWPPLCAAGAGPPNKVPPLPLATTTTSFGMSQPGWCLGPPEGLPPEGPVVPLCPFTTAWVPHYSPRISVTLERPTTIGGPPPPPGTP